MLNIECDGFSVRELQLSDAERLAEIGNDINIAKNMIDLFPHPYTVEDAKEWIETNRDLQKYDYAIVVDGKLAGCIGYCIHDKDKIHTASIGYWLGKEYWGRGIMTKVIKVIIKHLFEKFPIERIDAQVYTWNPASAKALEKAGFTFEGTSRMSTLKAGIVVDEWIYSIIRKDLYKVKER
ncbi:MAG: GNAT family N-acetyltransferase [Candidatus Woesearchaeota archaeon]